MIFKKILFALIMSTVGILSCATSEPEVEVEPSEEIKQILITQEALDEVTRIVAPADSAITGNGFGVRMDGSDRNIKDIYTNKPINRPIQPGDIIVIRSFFNVDGRRGQLEFVDLMVRREVGYNDTGGNFEYFRMDFDLATDYSLHPNGLVPILANQADRGLDIARAACVACHRLAPDGDFLFTIR
jgi:hypothetical protein